MASHLVLGERGDRPVQERYGGCRGQEGRERRAEWNDESGKEREGVWMWRMDICSCIYLDKSACV